MPKDTTEDYANYTEDQLMAILAAMPMMQKRPERKRR